MPGGIATGSSEPSTADMPYDALPVRLQLAGDEIEPDDPTAASSPPASTRCYPDMVDLNDQGLRRQNALDDITETALDWLSSA